MTKQKINITKIAEEIEKEKSLEIYWDYRDRLSDEQIIKIIKEDDGLNEIENELYDFNLDYICDEIRGYIIEYTEENNINLTDEEDEELKYELEGRYNFNINDILKNSSCNIRLELLSNEDMINLDDCKNSETIKYFKNRFKGKYKVKDLKEEILDMCGSEYALITFFFKVSGENILRLRKDYLSGKITLRKGLNFGLFNSYSGCGSMLEIPLLKNIILNVKDWRVKDIKGEIINKFNGEDSEYYSVGLYSDELKSYGIQQTYGLVGECWKEY